jgi:hypothetical protein
MAITGRERGPQPAVRNDRRLSDFRPPQLSVLQPPLTAPTFEVEFRGRLFFGETSSGHRLTPPLNVASQSKLRTGATQNSRFR